MGSTALEYKAATDALDALILYIEVNHLSHDEGMLALDVNNSQRDLLAKAKHRAEEARALLDDITHGSLIDQSL